MENILKSLDYRLRKLLTKPAPDFNQFEIEASDQLKETHRSISADIFFSADHGLTHKWLHYFDIYDRMFKPYIGSSVKILEIGVFKGGSLEMWRKFLGEKATIFGVDIDPACAQYDGKFGSVRIGSQDDPDFLRQVVKEMGGVDIVLDDGSHIATHQRTSFEALFPLLSNDGLYIIEDMHTAYWLDYEGGLKRKGTAIEFLKDKIDAMHAHYSSAELNSSEAIPEINSIQFFDSVAVIHKKKQHPRRPIKIGKI